MSTFTIDGYNSYSGCDIVVSARLNQFTNLKKAIKEKVYTLGSIQTLSVSTHQDKKPVRVIGSANALDYTMGQRTIAGSLVFAVFDKHFATEMFEDLTKATGKTFLLPDELPGMDITISFANEYGRTSRMAIYGLRIINEGQVMSINDLYTENTYQFVATAMEPLRKGETIYSHKRIENSTVIESSVAEDETEDNINGEDIVDAIESLPFDDYNKIDLTVITEQPLYNEDEGIAKFYLSPNQTTGSISIFDVKKNKVAKEIQILGNKEHHAFLSPGVYSAWYSDKDLTLSNVVDFNIIASINFDAYNDDAPTIEDVTKDSIKFICNNPTHTIGVVYNIETSETFEKEIESRYCTIENLQFNTDYKVYTKDEFSSISKTAKTKTLNEDYDIVTEFKKYVEYNSNILSKDFAEYQEILDTITNKDIIYTLNKHKSQEAKELIFIAIKFQNEYIDAINNHNENMPTKSLSNVFGNSFKFNTGVSKTNIFINKNKKDYFENCILYPTEVDYTGKANSIYNVVGVGNDYVKSPKYCFYSFSDNDKEKILNTFGEVNMLEDIDIYKFRTNSKLSANGLKCLAAKENKTKDISLLKAPTITIDESLNLIADINYLSDIGLKGNEYYLCVNKLNEVLDKTPVRKIKIQEWTETLIVNSYSSFVNSKDIFCAWIEDERFNIISDLGFASVNEEIVDINSYIVNNELNNIIKKIETAIKKPNYLSEFKLYINTSETGSKNLYYEIACALLRYNEDEAFDLIYELFKINFNTICINKERYNKVEYDKEKKKIKFNNANDSSLIKIAIKKDEYKITAINNQDFSIIDDNYDIYIYYLISNNPAIKSGFVLISNNKQNSYLIDMEVK